MKDAAHALEVLVQVTEEHGPRVVSSDTACLEKLGLKVRIRLLQTMAQGAGAMAVVQFDASTDNTRSPIGVTCVGIAADLPGASGNAVAQWCLGVLPVLVQWRGGHTCFVTTDPFESSSPAGNCMYDALLGPVIERGEHDAGDAAAPSVGGYLSLLTEPLRAARLRKALHWLECFAIRSADGSIDVTCRLDNRDWMPGHDALAADAAKWPGATPSFHSRRQFLLLVPQGAAEERGRRSFWTRVFGGG